MIELLGGELLLHVVVVNRAQGHEELLSLVLHHSGDERVNLSCVAEEHLALSVLHVLLDVESYCLCNAEILHVLRNSNAHLLCQLEVVVDGVA